MKKTLALILALAMVFSTVTVAFAEETVVEEVEEAAVEVVEEEVVEAVVSEEAAALATIGMLEGTGDGVTAEYEAEEMTRLIAASALLKLKGLYEEAIEYDGVDNFADVEDYVWAQGKNLMAYLKANPALGFGGDEKGNFNPSANIDEQSYYKVLLETLGYKQTTAEVTEGDFAWDETIEFAESIGLKPAGVEKFTVGDLAKATVSALKAKTKDGKVYIATLVEANKVDADLAVAAELMEEAKAVEVAVDEVKAIGNTVVEIVFEDDVDEAALGNADNYAIEGLEIKEVVVAGSDTVRLETAAMSAGKLYVITVGEEKVKFTGIGKVSGAPVINKVESKDVEEVKVTFSKVLDFETATDINNYTIANVEVVEAEVDGDEVTLTTSGLLARKQYTLKVAEVKSIDGVKIARNASKSFFTNPDTAAPIVSKVVAKTNEKVVVTFNEEVTKETAEDLANYVIKAGSTELAIEKAELVEDDDDEYKEVELVTEPQKAGTRYSITIDNIVDKTKAANAMKKAVTKSFTGKRADEKAPTMDGNPEVISKNNILIKFKDDSDLEEATVLDTNNYMLKKGSEDRAVELAEKVYFKDGVYMVNLVVEELDLGSYSLEATNISDEFGNVMDDKKSYFTVTRDKYASAKVKSYKVTAKDKMELTFDKPLVPASAKDLANYSFNKDLGSPKKLAYKEKDYKVTITVNDFVLNKDYKLTVNGVEDLAGNVLNFKLEFNASYGAAETPKLDAAYAVNKHVVALAFDEKIGEFDGAKLTLKDVDEKAGDVELKAKALVEDDTVVEFSDYGNKELTPDVTYYVASITSGIKGAGGEAFDNKEDFSKHLVYGIDEKPERAEVLYVEQINGVSFELMMSKNVEKIKSTDGKTITADVGNATATFKVKTKDDVVTLTIIGNIKENAEYKINLSSELKDLHDIPVLDQDEEDDDNAKDIKTILYADYVDEDAPYIVNVVAKDRETIEIEYSEAMKTAATYSIYNADENVSKNQISAQTPYVDSDDEEFVIIKLNTPLEGRYDYRLVVKTTAAQDLAGNKAEEEKDDEFYFDGTDLAPIGTPENINLTDAEEAVEEAVNSRLQADVNAAKELVDALPAGNDKDVLQGKLDAIEIVDDTSVKKVVVKDVYAEEVDKENNVYNVELQAGTVLADLVATDIVVTPTNASATAAEATTTDNGKTWKVEVTAEDTKTKATYTINVSVKVEPKE